MKKRFISIKKPNPISSSSSMQGGSSENENGIQEIVTKDFEESCTFEEESKDERKSNNSDKKDNK